MLVLLLALAVLAVIAFMLWRRNRRLEREHFIRNYAWPKGLLDRLAKRRPELSLKDRVLVTRGLKQFFLAHLRSGRRFVSMPSQVADDLWHEFILYTRGYDAFCRQAFGRFLHHTPAVVLGEEQQNNAGLRRCWYWCCREENIDPKNPSRLPLLFALDAKLAIADGFIYAPDCKTLTSAQGGTVHCGADLGGGDGSDGGSGDSSDSSGDGGSGCGGGCGGGD
ncbi:glycine-rich domain-containing protein [Sulfurisoma sediminicola]|uniref:Uncharacterized protein n=1 Tax=Sulfurisoma sediminicola TaxID=1381557 RepID=A0A497XNT1_9PROT|nr:hypothetical protein [Sulfurisoma sediminicola]RLJ67859.1 hypothetical protein DFR35_0409 [Sulfurisoma sediminicola]